MKQSAFSQRLNGTMALNENAAIQFSKFLDCDIAEISPSLAERIKSKAESIFGKVVPAEAVNDDYAFIQSSILRGAAGKGRMRVTDDVEKRLAFRTKYLQSRDLNPDNLKIGQVEGLSMLNLLDDGDTYIYDISRKEILSNKVYKIHGEVQARVKRLVKRLGMVEVTSDNKEINKKTGLPEYPTEIVSQDVAQSLIIGRVVWHCGDL